MSLRHDYSHGLLCCCLPAIVMVMPTRSEFIALCRAQVALLTQGLGASFCVVYLAKEILDDSEPQLVPIVSYPDATVTWNVQSERWQIPTSLPASSGPRLLGETSTAISDNTRFPNTPIPSDPITPATPSPSSALVPQRQMVVPLIHETVLMGLLVVGRDDRTWNEWEQAQIQRIADTLALASVLDQHNQWLEQDQLQRQQVQAQQRDMLDNLIHQFRNSLTALQTFSKLMLKRLLPGDSNREIATSIAREANRLKELSEHLESVLHATDGDHSIPVLPGNSDQGQVVLLPGSTPSEPPVTQSPLISPAGQRVDAPLALEVCDLAAILAPLLTSFSTIAQEKGLSLLNHLPETLPTVLGNSSALREVFNNLIENAVKYTPAGGLIWVEVRQPESNEIADFDDLVGIAISDTGPGIPPEDLPHLFERRFRGVQANSDIPGTGLGLAIARSLIRKMNGDIQVTSPARSAALENYLNTAANHCLTAGPGVTVTVWVELSESLDPHPG